MASEMDGNERCLCGHTKQQHGLERSCCYAPHRGHGTIGAPAFCDCTEYRRDTAAWVNSLPDDVRDYIHSLEARCDPSGDIQSLRNCIEQRDALLAQV